CNGHKLSAPNDLVFDSEGGFYFTDLGKRYAHHRDNGGLYYALPDGSSITELVYPIVTPNGVGLSPDEKTVYVADTETSRVYAWDILSPGKVKHEPFPAPYGGRCVAGLPGFQRFDSLALEASGNICVATLVTGHRADAVIVNGGLGPTVDDLSQEIAARAAGVELVLSEEWLTTMEAFFQRRSRVMSANNRKQAMLPATAEILDNPIGTACGFAMEIGKARFFFTPGVPRELRRMLEEQIIPRLLARSGAPTAIQLKRFHSYGLGESHVDALLEGVAELVPDGSAKLGFRAHYPQIETKVTVRGADMAEIEAKLAPVSAEVRKRLGNFILAEDDDTLEGVILKALNRQDGSL